MEVIIRCLRENPLLGNRQNRHKVRIRSSQLYKKSYIGSYLKFIHPEKVALLLKDLYEGSYGFHSGGRTLAH